MNKNNKTSEKIAVFESIGYTVIPALFFYLKRGYKVTYFEVNGRVKQLKWFKRGMARHQLEEISWGDFELELHYLSHDLALDNIEQIYSKRFAKSRLAKKMTLLLKSEMIHAAYKKALIEKLQNFYHIQLLLNDIARRSNLDDIAFVPSEFIQSRNYVKSADAAYNLDSHIHMPFWAYITSYISYVSKKVFYIAGMAGLPVWTLRKTKRIVPDKDKASQDNYQVGIRIYRTDFGFHYKYRSIDFLLDGENLTADNTLFCIETGISEDYMQKLKEKEYNVVEIPKILEEVNRSFIKNVFIKTFVPACYTSALLSLLEPLFMVETTAKNLYGYLLWRCFLDKYRVKHYVVYNNFNLSHIIRNILLSQEGVQTWYYMHSSNFGDICAPIDGRVTLRHVVMSFLYYDNMVSWGNKSMGYFAHHPTCIKQYPNLGCLWSEHVRAISQKEGSSNLQKEVVNKINTLPGKIIGVFDTTFGKDTSLQSGDIVLFIEGVLKLLEDNPDTGVIFKEKNPFDKVLSRTPEIGPVYDKLRSHERCYATGNEGDAAETTAMSDLVVSACFTSPTVEALGARKKAIYFDASCRFRGYYYDKFPNLVAHGYEELKNLVHYWLYEVTNDEFDIYLERYVKGELDAYVDGRAITRFRELLKLKQ